MRDLGRGLAGQAFARDQAERRGQRQLVLARHAVVALGLAFLRELGAQVRGHAGHELRPNGLDAHLLERIEHLARLAPAGDARCVERFVVGAQAEGGGVGRAAQLRHLGRRQGACGQRQAHALARHTRRAGLEGDLYLGVGMRDGAQRAGGGALELFLAREVLLGHRGPSDGAVGPAVLQDARASSATPRRASRGLRTERRSPAGLSRRRPCCVRG